MAHTDIDRVNGYTIRKLHSPDKLKSFGFISGIKGENGNLSEVQEHATLTEAREARGFVAKIDPAKATPPKSAHEQNRKGYRADNTAKKK